MQNFTLDLSQLTVVPDARKGVPVTAGPRQQRTPAERAVIKTALEFGKPFNPNLGGALEVLQLAERPPIIRIAPSPTVGMASRSGALTVGLGLTDTVGIFAAINLSGGVYGSTTGEFGVFGTTGFVAGIVSGASGGVECSFVFGTPADFSGRFVSFQASVGLAEFGAGVGGSLLFSPGPPGPGGRVPLTFMGYSLNITVGVSALPVSVSIEWSNTLIKPLIK